MGFWWETDNTFFYIEFPIKSNGNVVYESFYNYVKKILTPGLIKIGREVEYFCWFEKTLAWERIFRTIERINSESTLLNIFNHEPYPCFWTWFLCGHHAFARPEALRIFFLRLFIFVRNPLYGLEIECDRFGAWAVENAFPVPGYRARSTFERWLKRRSNKTSPAKTGFDFRFFNIFFGRTIKIFLVQVISLIFTIIIFCY